MEGKKPVVLLWEAQGPQGPEFAGFSIHPDTRSAVNCYITSLANHEFGRPDTLPRPKGPHDGLDRGKLFAWSATGVETLRDLLADRKTAGLFLTMPGDPATRACQSLVDDGRGLHLIDPSDALKSGNRSNQPRQQGAYWPYKPLSL